VQGTILNTSAAAGVVVAKAMKAQTVGSDKQDAGLDERHRAEEPATSQIAQNPGACGKTISKGHTQYALTPNDNTVCLYLYACFEITPIAAPLVHWEFARASVRAKRQHHSSK
jgi:hypothetical protein